MAVFGSADSLLVVPQGGRLLATGGQDGVVRVWSLLRPSESAGVGRISARKHRCENHTSLEIALSSVVLAQLLVVSKSEDWIRNLCTFLVTFMFDLDSCLRCS